MSQARGGFNRGQGRGVASHRGHRYPSRGRGWGRGRSSGSYLGGSSQPSSSQGHSQLIQTTLPDQVTPYKGWPLYFPAEVYSEQSHVVQRAQAFEKYFLRSREMYCSADLEAQGYFNLDFKELLVDQNILENVPELAHELYAMPEVILNCLGLAMHQILTHDLERDLDDNTCEGNTPAARCPSLDVCVSKVICRLLGFEPVTPLKNLKANCYGKLVAVKGTVVRVSNVKPLCTQMAFQCSGCGHIQAVRLPDGKYIMPNRCKQAECKSRTFLPRRSHPFTETIDWQTIRVQEIMNHDQHESGRIPRTVDCELSNDLVDSCVPGDNVLVTGVVKVMRSDEGRGRQKDQCMFLLYINVNSVINAKGGTKSSNSSESEQTTGLAMEFSMKELYAIEEIQGDDNLFRLLVGSLCPSIYGNELVKAGLILGLFGGTPRFTSDKNGIPVRGDPHVLVVGDPGLGKSQMLQAVANVAPRSVYVCGNTTTTSGLTVTLSRDGGGGDFALEAGALVLADQGCCCIDEFDKIGSQHQALLEAMEQQSISIAKAGIVCSLPARASIIAAANPVGGHYNKAKTVSENLRMGSALLSRFDLVFILLDKPDEELDAMLSEHVMAIHVGKKRVVGSSTSSTPMHQTDEAYLQWIADKPLSERLKVPRNEIFDPIPPQLLKKYVGYARKYVHPKISPEAVVVLQSFYLDLRRQHQTQDSTPITTRQLESLIRLTEARARLELREVATEADARDVVEIMKYSMVDTFMDQYGFLDFQRSQHGSGMSSRSQAKKLVAALQAVYNQTYNALFTVQELRDVAKKTGVNVPNFEEFVYSLNDQGYLLKKGPHVYQLQTAGY